MTASIVKKTYIFLLQVPVLTSVPIILLITILPLRVMHVIILVKLAHSQGKTAVSPVNKDYYGTISFKLAPNFVLQTKYEELVLF